MKACSKCGSQKESEEFYRDPRNRSGLSSSCKECIRRIAREYAAKHREHYREYQYNVKRYNIPFIYKSRYDNMKRRVEGYYKRRHSSNGKELLSIEEFKQWCKDNEKEFYKLYEPWKESGFSFKLIPTIDRKDNDIGYIPSNMQWLSLSDNKKKGS